MNPEEKKIEYNRVERRDGNYDFAHPSKTESQYLFFLRSDAPKFESRGFTVTTEQADKIDREFGDDVCDVAKAILAIHQKFIFSSSVKSLPPLIDYLGSCEDADATDYYRSEIAKMDAEIERLETRRDQYISYLRRHEAEKIAGQLIDAIK